MAFTKVLDTGLDAGHVGIRTAGAIVGTGFTMLNFVGAGNTFAINGNTVDISIAGGGGAGDAIVKDNFVVTANTQSVFTLTNEYATGLLDVYVNGIKLPEADFTEQLPDQVTLVQAAVKGDTVEFIGFRERITNTVINTQVSSLQVSGIATVTGDLQVTNLNVTGIRHGNLGAGGKVQGSTGFAKECISIKNSITVSENYTAAPEVGDDIVMVKYEDVIVDDGYNLTVDSGDLISGIYELT